MPHLSPEDLRRLRTLGAWIDEARDAIENLRGWRYADRACPRLPDAEDFALLTPQAIPAVLDELPGTDTSPLSFVQRVVARWALQGTGRGLPTDGEIEANLVSALSAAAAARDRVHARATADEDTERKQRQQNDTPNAKQETPEPGVTLRDVASILQGGDFEETDIMLKRWNKAHRAKPKPVGKAPKDRRANLYRCTEISDWAEKVEGYLTVPKAALIKRLTTLAVQPEAT